MSWRHGGLLLSENIFLDRMMAKQYVYRFAVNWLKALFEKTKQDMCAEDI